MKPAQVQYGSCVLVPAMLGGLMGAMLGSSLLLFELFPEAFRSADLLLANAILIGPPVLAGIAAATILTWRVENRNRALAYVISFSVALFTGIVVASWMWQRLANA